MKNSNVAFILILTCLSFASCSDSSQHGENPAEDVDAQILRVDTEDDVVASGTDETDVLADETVDAHSGDDVSKADDAPTEEVMESEQLPSDPTEDPGQEASYYEFPAWHIPVPPEG